MDPRTTLVIATLMMLLNGGVLGLMHRRLSAEIQPAAASWRIATLLIAGAFLLLAVQDRLPLVLVLPVANGMLLLGVSGYWLAVRRFYGLPARPAMLLPTAAVMVLVLWFTAAAPSLAARIIVVSLAIVAVTAATLHVLLVSARGDPAQSRRVLAGLFTFICALMLVRAVYYIAVPDDAATILAGSGPLNLAVPLFGAVLPVIGTTIFLLLCFERIRADFERAAATDYLTGLPNRRTVTGATATAFIDAARQATPLAVAVIDIDHFKSVNDRHGHAAGDEALRQVAAILATAAPAHALVGRHGGEEFVMLLPGHDDQRAVAVAEGVREAVAARELEAGNGRLVLTVSIGIGVADPADRDPDQMLRRADDALYAAKAAGRNRVVSQKPEAG
jgi:diguanylate cyclase (GGDEF)-like protein